MRKVIFTLSFLLSAVCAYTQGNLYSDLDFHFNKRYSQCEDRWVVFPKDDNDKYSLGFIYIDEEAGFTFDYLKNFSIENGKIILDTAQPYSIKYRLTPNMKNVALVPESLFNALKIDPIPAWLSNYKHYKDDSAVHNLRWGYLYDELGEYDIALSHLSKAYKITPDTKGLRFELAFCYNAMQRYKDAIPILTTAIQYEPNNHLFYKELGYAYQHTNDFDNAIIAYTKGIKKCTKTDMTTKGEMSFNLAIVYKRKNDIANYKYWGAKAKEWMPKDSPYQKLIAAEDF